jgi:hypothetical protein
VAALVSEIGTDRPLGTPNDLRAHARVLDTVTAGRTAVLPFRFGGVVRDEDAIADELLGPFEQQFAAALEDLGDLAQFTLRGVYQEDRILREIIADREDIARLREEIAGLSEDAGYYQRIRLGELISQEITARCAADADVLVDRLAPLAVAVSTATDGSAGQTVDASFLVHQSKWADFEAAAEDLAVAWNGRVELRLLGPLAPYDFVSDALAEAEEVL